MKRFVCAFVLLVSCTAAFAGEMPRIQRETPGERAPGRDPVRTGQTALQTGQKERTVAPMFYVLPDLGNTAEAVMELRISNAKRTLVRQTIVLPARLPENARIDVLFTHANELQHLRTLDKNSPETIRFVAEVNGRVVTDAFFADVDSYGASLSEGSSVGTVRGVEVKLVDPRRIQAQGNDPECLAECDRLFQECIDRCDPRGDSCSRCTDDYNACAWYCPDVCTEPKSVSNYTVWTPTNWAWYGTDACRSPSYQSTGNVWWEIYVWYTVTTYQRTEHCDGSYTDTQVGQYNTNGWCWAEQWDSCNNAQGGTPFPVCQ